MTIPTSCVIKLLNKSYEIKCPESEVDNLTLAAQKLNHYLQDNKKKFKHLDAFQTLLLAALNVSHELVTSLHRQEAHQEKMNGFIRALEEKIDQAISGDFAAKTKDKGKVEDLEINKELTTEEE